MTTDFSFPKMKLTPHVVMEQRRNHGSNWTSWGAAGGLACGIISPLIGSVLTVIPWLEGPDWHGLQLHRTATVLFVLTIPLLAFGAHCLDLLDRQAKEARKRRSN